MTGRVDTPDEQWSNAGFNDIVHKPLYKEAFLGKIERWINQQVRFFRHNRSSAGDELQYRFSSLKPGPHPQARAPPSLRSP
jgi:hypothetical protein